ncbi:MAG TPA: aldo/keto reductase [Chitinophagales bacterium]|nr:aldo/keto reductase [Chitinophagales bacterium]
MEYRMLGTSDLNLSVITFGAWAAGGWMWGSTDRKLAKDAIIDSFDQGVTTIDTAPIYGMGVSEEIVGEAVQELSRDKVQILTKFGMRWDLKSPKGDFTMDSEDNQGNPVKIYRYASKESVIQEVEDSLRRLKTDYIDLIQLHWPDTTTPISETMEAMELLLQQGKVRAAGVCNYDTVQVKEAKASLNIVSDQIPYSMLRREVESELIPYAIENKLGIIAYSPLERGLLTGKYFKGEKLQENDHRNGYFKRYEDLNVEAFLKKIEPLALDKNATVSQLVLKWTTQQPGITIVLAGARNSKQAIENAQSVDVILSASEKEMINQALTEI